MKLAYSVATPDVSGAVMAFSGDFQANISAIKAIGYEAVELLVRNPDELDALEIAKQIDQCGLSVAAVGTTPAALEDGLTLLAKDQETRQKAMERILRIIDFAEFFHVPVSIARYRGELWKEDREGAVLELSSALKQICDYAQKKNISVLLEPQSKVQINNLNTTAETLVWIEQIGCENLGILFDTFHADLEETSLASGILGAKGKIGLVHCADSKRLPPGIGRINFTDVFAALKAIGYEGFVSVEINQRPDSYTVAELAYKNMKFLLDHVI